jgi:chemotaxis signal transduction protein
MSNETSNNVQNYADAIAPAEQASRKLQLVRAGSSLFGVFADEIATVVAWRKPTPLPHAAKSVLGVVSVQGRLLTVLDLASLPGGEPARNDAPSDIPNNAPNKALGQTPGSLVALRGDEQLALAVDEVGESIELDDSSFNAQPEPAGKLVLGALQRDGVQIKILNLKELFPTAIQGRERRRRRF